MYPTTLLDLYSISCESLWQLVATYSILFRYLFNCMHVYICEYTQVYIWQHMGLYLTTDMEVFAYVYAYAFDVIIHRHLSVYTQDCILPYTDVCLTTHNPISVHTEGYIFPFTAWYFTQINLGRTWLKNSCVPYSIVWGHSRVISTWCSLKVCPRWLCLYEWCLGRDE